MDRDIVAGRETRYGLAVWGANPGVGVNVRILPDRHWGPPSLLYNGYRVILGGKADEGVALTTHPM